MAELAQAIVTYELGSAAAPSNHYNIREVYTSADQYTPVVFILPTEIQGLAWDASQGSRRKELFSNLLVKKFYYYLTQFPTF